MPELTDSQIDMVVQMICEARLSGEWKEFVDNMDKEREEMAKRSRSGVEARRRKSKRQSIVEAFDAAAKAKREVSIEQLAREHGVSRATAYRALASRANNNRP
jgi:hypothetical protein